MGFNVLELFAKIGMDSSEFDKGLDSASSKLSSVGSKIGNGAKMVAKAGAAAVGAASTAVAGLTKQAVGAYGEYQQLTGGIETLFGAGGQSLEEYAAATGRTVEEATADYKNLMDAQQQMMNYANRAYASAGMSANEYMETAIQSSASMIASLNGDTKKAAQLTDMAIVDMSDNVNKMGTTMESIQNAYKGFSRGNFTMLDNLALGFAGTKEGMQELLDKAEELSGVEYDISSYADIVQAIHVVQENMGIAGTTSKEAAGTITGSLASVKAAWQNLVTGLANPDADLGQLISNVVDNASVAFNNLLPTIEQALQGIGKLVETAAPIIGEKLPELVTTVLPSLLRAGGELVAGIVKGISENGQDLLFAAGDLIEEMLTYMVSATSNGGGHVFDIISTILGVFEENYMQFIDLGVQIVTNIIDGFISSWDENKEDIIYYITEIIGHIGEVLPDLISAVGDLIGSLAESLPEILPPIIKALTEAVPDIVSALLNAFVHVFNSNPMVGTLIASIIGGKAIKGIAGVVTKGSKFIEGVKGKIEVAQKAYEKFTTFMPKISSAFSGIKSAVTALNTALLANPIALVIAGIVALIAVFVYLWNNCEAFREFWINLWEGIKEYFGQVWEGIKQFVSDAIEFITGLFAGIGQWFADRWAEIKEAFAEVGEFFLGIFTGAWDFIVGVFEGIGQWFSDRWEDIKGVFSGIGGWFKEKFQNAKEKAVGAWDNIKSKFTTVKENIKGAFSDAGSWFSEKFSTFKENAVGAWDNIKSKFSEVWEKIKEGFKLDDALRWGKDMLDNFIQGIKSKINAVGEAVKGVAEKIKSLLGFSEPEDGPLSNFHTYAPDMMQLFAKGVKDNTKLVTDQLKQSFDFSDIIASPQYAMADGGASGGMLGGVTEAINAAIGGITVQVQIGQDRVDDLVVKAIQRNNYRSGGR